MVLNILCFILQGLATILVAIVVAIWAAYASAVDDCRKIGKDCYCNVNGELKIIHGKKKQGISYMWVQNKNHMK